ncbi:hypothetical protein V1524DRAFT_411563 [Lipomyces starkeyi]
MSIGGANFLGANKLCRADDSIFERGNFSGGVARYGICEYAMAAISNGITADQPRFVIPSHATFLMVYLYAAAGVRTGGSERVAIQ